MALNELKTNFEDFVDSVNEEAYIPSSVLLKRKYRDNLGDKVGLKAPIRSKVLEFIEEKGVVTHEELDEFINTIQEDKGKKPSWGWVRRNASLVDKNIDEEQNVTYSLTKRAKRFLEAYRKYEEFANYTKNKAKKAGTVLAKSLMNEELEEDCPECQAARFEKWCEANEDSLTEEMFTELFPDEVYEGSAGWAKMFGICCANDKDPDTKLSGGCKKFFEDNPDAKKECD